MLINVRKAVENDRAEIALCIAEGFEEDFSIFCRRVDKVAAAVGVGIKIDKFYVTETGGEIAGVIAISDCDGRAAAADKAALKKNFGLIKGFIAQIILKKEFEAELKYPRSTGYIEFVAVKKAYRRKGIASFMLKESMANACYKDYVLDVVDTNFSAIDCYKKLGFGEFKRTEEKHGKQKGFNAKIYMRYNLK